MNKPADLYNNYFFYFNNEHYMTNHPLFYKFVINFTTYFELPLELSFVRR